jgi:hypothetical protein
MKTPENNGPKNPKKTPKIFGNSRIHFREICFFGRIPKKSLIIGEIFWRIQNFPNYYLGVSIRRILENVP